ncbi:MAG TPA: TPM domain-containing protein [Candidatus Sulfotelmatobacter sp.]|nr:TPM domain-containing protein [Candidatus Sulfotelmatobacter sp.]
MARHAFNPSQFAILILRVIRTNACFSAPLLYNFSVQVRANLRWLTLLVFVLHFPAHAEPVKDLKPTGYVNDFAHVLDPSAISQMEDICHEIDEKAHAQIAVVTVNTLDGKDLESYSVDLAQKWGMGGKGHDRGVLILYIIRDHRARIEVGYGLESILPDGKVGGFQREAIPLMRNGEYSQALLLVTERVAGVIATDAGIQLTNAQPRAPTQPVREPDQGLSIGAIIAIIVVILIVLLTPLRTLLFWILFSSIFDGRGGGYRGGGGFGGFGGFSGGGGSGFGGFGGGSFGGGGASSSW